MSVSGPASSDATSALCAGVWWRSGSSGAAAPGQTDSVGPPLAASTLANAPTVSSTTSRCAFPNTVEMPATSTPGVRASSAIARQSSGSVRAPWPHAASVSIHTRGGAGSAPNGVSKCSGTKPWSPVRQVSKGTASVSTAATVTSAAPTRAR